MMTTNRHGSAVITLPSDDEILITRQFEAPASKLFAAYTTPELVRRWWGFDTSEWLVCEIDLRVGGTWRYVTREAEGIEVGFHGTYLELDAPLRLVSTEAFEGAPDPDDNASINTVTLSEDAGVTTLTVLCKYPSQLVRDLVIDSGMETGMQVSYDRMEDIVTA
jgi:uncharacterized protein YndB with AHSA1/START domain